MGVLARCEGDVKAAVKRLVQLERRGVRHRGAMLTYGGVTAFKASAISDEAMDRIVSIDTAEIKSKSAAAEGLLSWLQAVALKDPPSPQKAGMLVHTIALCP